MFVGHFAVGLAAKKASPSTPLPLLIVAAQLVDLVWPLFLLLGLETVRIAPGITTVTPLDFTSYPYTHSFLLSIVWGLAFGGAIFLIRRKAREAWVLAGCVVSHWLLDLVTHRPDLPLTPWADTKVGLELWSSMAGTLILELSMFVAGIVLYRSAVVQAGKRLSVSFWLFIGFICVIYLGNLFGPPPPSAEMIAIAGNAMWLFVVWAWWSERRHRAAGTATA